MPSPSAIRSSSSARRTASSHSLSTGIISALGADTVTPDFPLAEFFQTDAVINTGNSGGPMFTRAGELIGIVSHNISKSGGSEGLGFVVTSNTVKSCWWSGGAGTGSTSCW